MDQIQELPEGYHLYLAPSAPDVHEKRPALPPPVPPVPPPRSWTGNNGFLAATTRNAAGQDDELGLASRLQFERQVTQMKDARSQLRGFAMSLGLYDTPARGNFED